MCPVVCNFCLCTFGHKVSHEVITSVQRGTFDFSLWLFHPFLCLLPLHSNSHSHTHTDWPRKVTFGEWATFDETQNPSVICANWLGSFVCTLCTRLVTFGVTICIGQWVIEMTGSSGSFFIRSCVTTAAPFYQWSMSVCLCVTFRFSLLVLCNSFVLVTEYAITILALSSCHSVS